MAAGLSSRANGYKMTMEVGGKPVLVRVMEALQPFCDTIFVVGGYQIERLQELLKPFSFVTLIENKEYEQGMFSSVQAGVSKITAERFFLTPGDYPLLQASVCKTLLSRKESIVLPRYHGRGGHPILLRSEHKKGILKESIDSNLKRYLQRQNCHNIEIEDEGILLDVDTPTDFENVRRKIHAQD